MRDGEDMFKQSVLNILSGSDEKKIARINKVKHAWNGSEWNDVR